MTLCDELAEASVLCGGLAEAPSNVTVLRVGRGSRPVTGWPKPSSMTLCDELAEARPVMGWPKLPLMSLCDGLTEAPVV
jgi:hypothetical protein